MRRFDGFDNVVQIYRSIYMVGQECLEFGLVWYTNAIFLPGTKHTEKTPF